MGLHHCVVVLAFLTLLHGTVANYEWTGKEWRWVSQRSSSRDDEDLGSGYGLPDDEEEGDGHEPPGGLVENMKVVADQSTITISWQPPSRETWNSCLLGYQISYRKKNGFANYATVEGTYEDKETGKDYFFEEVEGSNHSYVIRDLDSESTYMVAVQVFNPWGKDQRMMKEVEVTTEPEPCLESSVPHADHLVETGSHMIRLQMGGWVDANCPTNHLTVQGRLKGEEEWSSAASRVEPGAEFTLPYLTPATWFHVKVTGVPERSSANSTTWEFEVATLAEDGSGFPGCVIERGVKYSGNNLSNKKGISQRTCALLCFRTSSCTHWTYNKKFQGGKCWLKSSNKGRTRSTKGSNSGQKACGAKGFSLSMLTSEAASAMEECRDPWTQLYTGCYLFQPRNSTWYEAKQTCKQSGGHLVEIENWEEWDSLQETFLSETWDDTNVNGVWIGLNDVFHDGTWVWDHSGRPVDSDFWARGEPDNLGGAQHCGMSLTNPKESTELRGGDWLDVSCEENQLHVGTLCEAPGSSVPTYTREQGKGWVNVEGRATSMSTSVTTTRRRGMKTYLRVHDAEECERECTATAPCVAFTFIPMIHRCDLKAEADALFLEDVGGAVSGKLNGERPTPPTSPERVENSTICLPCLPVCSIEVGVKYSGHNLFPAKGKTQMECAALCLHEPECNYWTHNARLAKCWLKKSDRGRSPSTHGSNSGQKSCGVTGSDLATGRVARTACSCESDCTIEENVKYSGHNLYTRKGIKGGNQEACAGLCFKDAKCKFWTYNPRVKKCWLKTSDEGKTASTKGSVSGEKSCGAPALENSKEARDTEDSQEGGDAEEDDVAEERSRGVMTSPTNVMTSPTNYPPNIHETRTIEVPKGKKIRMQFSQYEVESCCDYVRITDEDGTVLKEDKHQPAKNPIVSRTDTVHVLFHSDASVERKGWRLEWEAVEDEASSSDSCLSPWTRLSTGCYLFQEVSADWFQADGTCQQHNGFIVEIDSAEENAALLGEIQKGGVGFGVGHIWLGVAQFGQPGNWTLLGSGSGAPSFLNWDSPEKSEGHQDSYDGFSECAAMLTSNGKWIPLKCSPTTSHLVVCEKSSPVKMAQNEGLKVGDTVRVRASVSKPEYGWGDVDHTSIGQVDSLEGSDEVLVDFPEQDGWRALTSELEVVLDNSEETTTTTTQRPEDGLTVGLEFPSHVMLGQPASLRCRFTRRPGQELYSIKWFKDDQEFFRVTGLDEDMDEEFPKKEFPREGVNIDQNQRLMLGQEGGEHTLVLADTELATTGTYWCEITEAQAPLRTVGQERNLTVVDFKFGDKVKVRDSVVTPHHGWGDVDRTSVGTLRVLPPSGYETLIIDFPEHQAWSGLLSEVEVVPDEPDDPSDEVPSVESAMTEPTSSPGCVLTEDTIGYDCSTENVNFQNRENSQVVPGIESWRCCRQLCWDAVNCNFWVWAHQGAGLYAGNCALMSGYGNTAGDTNVVSGPRVCA